MLVFAVAKASENSTIDEYESGEWCVVQNF